MDSFLDFLWVIIVGFFFIAYLMVMFSIIGDLFRDRSSSGGMKAVWIFCLILFPFITALVYMVVKGSGMAERQHAAVANAVERQEAYIRQVAGKSAAAQITEAKELLDQGAITEAEFATLKAKALA
ncbi:SHOCT domain-containing protein [Antrihabitans sp. YC2-6]|uniref:SHOCT domain-containing protein n=1 Tax=Antrihabitans sp. YC2-6 TaxID=2799498 RepID=UPI0018F70114|nr:SHOCT domain-containing protein [Antrihabitans sp. YC2-6]MBJ8345123.1 SHOCT domain-containing protein [Antrihabitans sp. YC2-6]